jgi:YegS/Rv2252/BmrU family lipid kinase
VTTVAVVAHRGKSLDGGLDQLRAVLAHEGVDTPLWYEVPKSKKAPPKVEEAVAEGADLVVVWGGDGMVQRCVDALRDPEVAVGIIPAGTANLLATHLGIPQDLEAAVAIALHGGRRTIDVGEVNGERFAVMTGAGFDARMIREVDRSLKGRLGRAAYLWTGARNLRGGLVAASITVDGTRWFDDEASCVLVGNVGTVIGGLPAFPEAEIDDGVLELGVVTADGITSWTRVLSRMALGTPQRSPLTRMSAGRTIEILLEQKLPYELDGGDRKETEHLAIEVKPGALTVCVPEEKAR